MARWALVAAVLVGLAGVAYFTASRQSSRPEPVVAQVVNAGPVEPEPSSSALAIPVAQKSAGDLTQFVGSTDCRDCHQDFYEKWSTSHHGLAMQPFTKEFAEKELKPHEESIKVGENTYQVLLNEDPPSVLEKGPKGDQKFKIEHAMGGKNVYYFLTSWRGGRLQTLPVAYDVRRQAWFDTAASGVRHFPGRDEDAPLHWTDREYTFNTSCYGCHVSQLSTNYDNKTDTYHTVWAEPGINCETCHGPAGNHDQIFREHAEAKKDPPEELHLVTTRDFNVEQANTMCAPCHAKMSPLTLSFEPGGRYFDHYDLVTLEDQDFYPDGRDLGENYTYTGWRMSPCVKAGGLDCMHCHTSSGRSRFTEEEANNACMPCHQSHVEKATAHTHHLAGSAGNKCISCHMPTTEFARMRRSDHSMRPPMPSATIAFKSPNACNMCHTDKDAAWADKYVREWRTRDYQAPVLNLGSLVKAARERDWSRLPEILNYIQREDHDEVFTTTFIRLLWSCTDSRKWPALIGALKDPSPLVRASAADALTDYMTDESLRGLLQAAKDDFRLVRVRAAGALASAPRGRLSATDQEVLDQATREYRTILDARPDDPISHFNLGNYYMARGDLGNAVSEFERAQELEPRAVLPLVNASIVYSNMGQNEKAETALRRVLKQEPNNAAANLNLGLLMAEMGRRVDAEKALRAALAADPQAANAAYNLGVLLAEDRPDEALEMCRKAHQIQPTEPKYSFTFAFYLHQTQKTDEATKVLKDQLEHGSSTDVYALLGGILEEKRQVTDALKLYEQASADERLSAQDREGFRRRGAALAQQSAAGP